MRDIAATALLSTLAGCAAIPVAPSGPAPGTLPAAASVPEAVAGPHRVRFTHAERRAAAPPGPPEILDLHFEFSTEVRGVVFSWMPGRSLVETTRTSYNTPVWVIPWTMVRDANFHVPVHDPGTLGGGPAAVTLWIPLLRVSQWKDHERSGLMDASLDEEEWPPFHLRFAGEGETFWLSATMATAPRGTPTEDPTLADHLSFCYVTEHATVRDAKGRDLVHYSTAVEGGGAVASFAVHKPGDPVPEDSSIAYPVTVRLRIPETWEAETARFVLKDVPLPPWKDGGP